MSKFISHVGEQGGATLLLNRTAVPDEMVVIYWTPLQMIVHSTGCELHVGNSLAWEHDGGSKILWHALSIRSTVVFGVKPDTTSIGRSATS